MSTHPEWISGNVFIRVMKFDRAGDAPHQGHTHNFDHTTIVFKGAVRVHATRPDGQSFEQDFAAPAHFLVKAGLLHRIVAIADDSEAWCVYSHRTPQGDVSEVFTGWMEAYQ